MRIAAILAVFLLAGCASMPSAAPTLPIKPELPTLPSTEAALAVELELEPGSDWSKWLFTGAVLADLASTAVGLERGLVEAGPIWGSLGDDAIYLAAAFDVGLIVARHKLGKRYPGRWWLAVDLGVGIVKAIAAGRNLELILEAGE